MKHAVQRPLAGLIVASALFAGAPLPARATAPPLSRDALAHCASQALTLRVESSRLTQVNSQMDAQRNAINQRTEALRAESYGGRGDTLDGGLDLHERRLQNNAAADAFNQQVEQLRRDIEAINGVRRDYDLNCSNRPFRHSDLRALPPPEQDAMRRGLGDIQVPYIDQSRPGPMPPPFRF